MSDLAHIQRLFASTIFDNEEAASAQQQLGRYIASDKLSATDHIRIYQDAVTGSLAHALQNIYPVCHKLVGEDFFNAMTRIFIRQIPSTTADLNHYGSELANFISGYAPAAELSYLADVARLEWCWHTIYHAPRDIPLSVASFQALSPEDYAAFRLRRISALTTLHSDYALHRIWEINQDDYHGDTTLQLQQTPHDFLIWRKDWDMRIDVIDASLAALLKHLQQNITLEQLLVQHDTQSPPFGELLGICLQQGWITPYMDEHNTPAS